MATKLYVGNLSFETTEADVRGLFEQSGEVKSCELILDKFTHESRGFAFVEMGSQEEAAKAIETCHGQDFQGRSLTVNEARPRAERPQRDFGGGGGGDYGGGYGGGGGGYGGGGGGGGGGGSQGRGKGARKSGKGSRRGIRNAKRGGGGNW